jgi:hypothetical protein
VPSEIQGRVPFGISQLDAVNRPGLESPRGAGLLVPAEIAVVRQPHRGEFFRGPEVINVQTCVARRNAVDSKREVPVPLTSRLEEPHALGVGDPARSEIGRIVADR